MPIEISWHTPNRILHVYVHDKLEMDDLEILNSGINRCVRGGIRPVHILLDNGSAIPPTISISRLLDGLSLDTDVKENIGWVVGIGEPMLLIKVVIPMVMRILRFNYMRKDTFEDAVSFLHQQDPTL